MKPKQQKPYPLQTLQNHTQHTNKQLAHHLNIPIRQLQKQKQTGLTEQQADHYAIKLGYHPLEIWNNWLQPNPTPPQTTIKP